MTNRLSILLLAASLCACSIVDPSKLEAVRAHDAGGTGMDMNGGTDLGPGVDLGLDLGIDLGAPDLGPPPVDMGPPPGETCGDPTAPLLVGNEPPFMVDTSTYAANFSPSCAVNGRTVVAGGREKFFRFEAAAGEYWHFHIQVDPTLDPAVQALLDPVIYVSPATNGTCDTRGAVCSAVSDVCGGMKGDEHFPFEAPANGTYWLGVDDNGTSPTGGRYILAVYKPNCGDMQPTHGEGCDGQPTCSSDCRQVIGMSSEGLRGGEAEFNDNKVEANLVEFASMMSLDITGRIGSGGDCYPDVFRTSFAPATNNLTVVAHPMAGGNCTSTFNDAVDLSITNMNEESRGMVDTDPVTTCPRARLINAPGGGYLVWLRSAMQTTSGVPYRLTFTKS